jgi:hypothetical protein
MRATHLVEALFFHAMRGQSTHTRSAPGIGKTQIHYQVAQMVREATGWKFPVIVQHNATADATDYKGLPFAEMTEDGQRIVAWHRQPWLIFKDPFMLFMDEYAQGQQAVMNATAPLLLDLEMDGIKLPHGSWVAAASNRIEDKAGTNKVPSHIPNRVCTLSLDFSIEDFRDEMFRRNKAPEFLSYSNFRPGSINDFDPAREINATPRQWEKVADEFRDLPKHIRMECIAGRVSASHAAEFEAFLRVHDEMPNPDLCIMEPETTPVPKSAAAQFAITGALSYKATGDNLDPLLKYMNRLPAEFGIMCVKDALKVNKKLVQSQAFTKWAIKNQTFLAKGI